jgi:hypothetical protein
MSRIPQDDLDPYLLVSNEDLPGIGEVYDEQRAIAITVQDAESAEAWLESHYFSVRWIESDIMYQNPPVIKVWENTTVPRANVTRFTVATHINALLAQVTNGMFYEDPPFILRPRPSTTADTVRAITAILGAQLDEINIEEEIEAGLFSALLFGTGIWKFGWKTETKISKRYERKEQPLTIDIGSKKFVAPTKRSQQFDVIETENVCNRPYFENVDVRHILVDPGCRKGDIRKAKFVIHRIPVTFRELMKMRDEQESLGGSMYDLPSEETIKSWFSDPQETEQTQGDDTSVQLPGSSPYLHHAAPRFQKTTQDPLDEPLELLERWTDEMVITVLNRTSVIRNEVNPLGRKPFLSVNWWNIPDAFWGLGLGQLLSSEQRIQQGLTNAALDIASLILNPLVVRSRGANVTSQSIRQRIGGIIDCDGDPEKAFRYQEVPEVPSEIFAQIQQSEARSEATSGANELLTQGNMPAQGRTSLGRTATGASALSSAASSRVGKFVEDFNRQVFSPLLWSMHEMNCERLPVKDLHEILNEELGEAFQIDEVDFFNAAIRSFDILAGSHLAVKQQMSQSVVLMSQLFESPQIMSELAKIGKYVDVQEILHMIADLSGFKNYYDIVKKLTPEMEQRMAQQNPANQQLQQKAQLQQQKGQIDEGINTQKTIERAVERLLVNAMLRSGQNQAVTGEPTGEGFGSNELG